MVFHVLSCFSFSFIFFHFLFIFFSFSFHFLSFSFIFFILFHILSYYFIVFSLSFFISFFFQVLKILFFASIAIRFPIRKFLSKKTCFGPSRVVPHWALFFSVYFFMFFFSFSFSLSISFHVFHSFSLYFPFVLLFKKKVLPFSFCFSFFLFSGAQNLWRHSLGKSAHSELALFALHWLIVTFPCGIVHILVMIRLRVEDGGRRVGQVLPSYQNRQKSALDETADVPQSSLFSLLSSLFSLHLSSINTYLSSPDSGPSQVARSPLAVPSQVARGCSLGGSPFFFLRNHANSEKVCSSHREKGEPPGRLTQFPR